MDNLEVMVLANLVDDLVALIVEMAESTGYTLDEGQQERFDAGIAAIDKYIDPDL